MNIVEGDEQYSIFFHNEMLHSPYFKSLLAENKCVEKISTWRSRA
jgi:hypothetical protein